HRLRAVKGAQRPLRLVVQLRQRGAHVSDAGGGAVAELVVVDESFELVPPRRPKLKCHAAPYAGLFGLYVGGRPSGVSSVQPPLRVAMPSRRGRAGMPHPAPPHRDPAPERRPHPPPNLPVQPTPLVGRERDIDLLRDRLIEPDLRLLTLTGSPGTGKTRLALA